MAMGWNVYYGYLINNRLWRPTRYIIFQGKEVGNWRPRCFFASVSFLFYSLFFFLQKEAIYSPAKFTSSQTLEKRKEREV